MVSWVWSDAMEPKSFDMKRNTDERWDEIPQVLNRYGDNEDVVEWLKSVFDWVRSRDFQSWDTSVSYGKGTHHSIDMESVAPFYFSISYGLETGQKQYREIRHTDLPDDWDNKGLTMDVFVEDLVWKRPGRGPKWRDQFYMPKVKIIYNQYELKEEYQQYDLDRHRRPYWHTQGHQETVYRLTTNWTVDEMLNTYWASMMNKLKGARRSSARDF